MNQITLEWELANLEHLSVCKDRPWLTLTYEELIAKPREMRKLLREYLDLPDPQRMEQYLERP